MSGILLLLDVLSSNLLGDDFGELGGDLFGEFDHCSKIVYKWRVR